LLADDRGIARLAPLLEPGEHRLPMPADYRIKVTSEGNALIVTVFANHRPLVTFGVAADEPAEDLLWPALEEHHRSLAGTDSPARKPTSVPWVAAVVMFATPDEAFWIADLERCFAWAWLERRSG
jgi:hypothetical protein